MLKLWVGFPVFYARVAPHAMIVLKINKGFSHHGNFNRLCKKKKNLNYYVAPIIIVKSSNTIKILNNFIYKINIKEKDYLYKILNLKLMKA
jgi:hypothetical protein